MNYSMHGIIHMLPEVKEEVKIDTTNMSDEECFWTEFDEMCSRYPLQQPTVFLEGETEEYYPQVNFSCTADSVILIRDHIVSKCTKHFFTELLAEDASGNIIWMDGRSAPYAGCWDGQYLGQTRAAEEYEIIEYDVVSAQKKT